jgi:serine phosphatase RsbU (regulator of sigma subunit)
MGRFDEPSHLFFMQDALLNEMFGKDCLEAVIRQVADASAAAILGSIIQAVQDFRASAKQEDDITLAVIKVVD